MTVLFRFALLSALGLAGCGHSAPPTLPPGSTLASFPYRAEALMRGAKTTEGVETRKPSIVALTYQIGCLTGDAATTDGPTADARFQTAKAALEAARVKTLPGDLGDQALLDEARAEANRIIVPRAQCEVQTVALTRLTSDRRKLVAWITREGLVAEAQAAQARARAPEQAAQAAQK